MTTVCTLYVSKRTPRGKNWFVLVDAPANGQPPATPFGPFPLWTDAAAARDGLVLGAKDPMADMLGAVCALRAHAA